MTDHGQGWAITGGGLAVGLCNWFVSHVTVINGVLQFFVLLISLIVAGIGLRKLWNTR